MLDASLAPATVAKLEALNSSRSIGSCSRGCTSHGKLHWWGVKLGDAGCRAFGEIVEQQKVGRLAAFLEEVGSGKTT